MSVKGRQRFLATLAIVALLVLVSAASASPPPSALGPLDDPKATSSALQGFGFWSSGWRDIAPGGFLTLEHNYGGDPDFYAVDLWFRDLDDGLGINHKAFGGMEFGEMYWGAAWQKLTATTIELYRFPNDPFADQVLVRIWIPDPGPLYDSGWVDMEPGQASTLTHNLNVDPEQFTVGMRFRDTHAEGIGVNLRAAGGLEAAGQFYGAAWQALTDTTIQVLRFQDDIVADQVRIQIYHPDPPVYNSGWRIIQPGEELTLPHNLGGNPLSYIVRAFARDDQPGGRGMNSVYGGGFEANGHFFGSNWEKLTDSTIGIYRFRNDDMAEGRSAAEVRVWIYLARARIFLPMIRRNLAPLAPASAPD
jgi:hypothetical protein